MQLLVTPTFERAVKKLHPRQKADLDEAVKIIAGNAQIGETKIGDLAGIQVYKFRLGDQLCLLAYRRLDEATLKLLMLGLHENFYCNLKRLENQG